MTYCRIVKQLLVCCNFESVKNQRHCTNFAIVCIRNNPYSRVVSYLMILYSYTFSSARNVSYKQIYKYLSIYSLSTLYQLYRNSVSTLYQCVNSVLTQFNNSTFKQLYFQTILSQQVSYSSQLHTSNSCQKQTMPSL